MTCDKAVRIVEKLADGEATPEERARAEAHIERCEDCREHYQFVRALESASENIDWPKPPEAYWQHLPSKVMARIEREPEEERSFWGTFLGPQTLRIGAVAATVTVVVAVGYAVLRDHPGELEPDLAERSRPYEERSVGKPAIDEKEVDPQASVPTAEEEVVASEPTLSLRAPAARAETAPSEERDDVVGWELADVAGADEEVSAAPAPSRRQNRGQRSLADEPGEAGMPEESDSEDLPFASEATLASDTARRRESAMSARAAAVVDDRCLRWRSYLQRYGDEGDESLEARYQVALCSIEEYRAEASDENLSAVERDVDAFLALQGVGDRAEELRRRARELRR